MLLCAGLLAAGGLLAAIAIRRPAAAPEAAARPARLHCPVAGPALHVSEESARRSA
jgi:hypothetical protein